MAKPDLNLLGALDVLLAEGSVARAAQRLRLSPSAMSRALARLRKTTGDPLLVDTVEKVFWGWRTKFSRAADALRAQRCAGPRRVSEKRPRTFASALGRISTMGLSKNQHLRDFWHRSIFDFFNSIGHKRKSQPGGVMSALLRRANVVSPVSRVR